MICPKGTSAGEVAGESTSEDVVTILEVQGLGTVFSNNGEIPEDEEDLPKAVEREKEVAEAAPVLLGAVEAADYFNILLSGGDAERFARGDDDGRAAEFLQSPS